MTRARTIAACDASVAAQMVPWSQVNEDLSVLAWRSVKRLTPATAAQEPQAIAEMIEHLQTVQAAAIEWARKKKDAGNG